MIIKVTAEHIKKGRRFDTDAQKCPIARALVSHGFKEGELGVVPEYIRIGKGEDKKFFRGIKSVYDFQMSLFDNQPVYPFSFNIPGLKAPQRRKCAASK